MNLSDKILEATTKGFKVSFSGGDCRTMFVKVEKNLLFQCGFISCGNEFEDNLVETIETMIIIINKKLC